MDLQKNAQRFTGFSALYDNVRPVLPVYAMGCIRRYLEREPEQVVDLGCGTGLSTLALAQMGGSITGVEPSLDMLRIAQSKPVPENVSFREGYAHTTGLPDAFADVVVCSQSFHWMEPESTLQEIGRILKPAAAPDAPAGGIMATVDCDWPPVCDWRAEVAWQVLSAEAARIAGECPELQAQAAHAWDKNGHLENMKRSGLFRYTRELVFTSREPGSAQRIIALAESQGRVQDVRKYAPGRLDAAWDSFCRVIRTACGSAPFDIDFGYRMRIGIR